MLYSDELVLIARSESQRDANGFLLPPKEQRTQVFGERKSVGTNEFYKFVLSSDEYHDEKYAEFAGNRYIVTRAYTASNGEETELTLSDMKSDKGGETDSQV